MWGLGEPLAVAPHANPQADGCTCEHTCLSTHTHAPTAGVHAGLPRQLRAPGHALSVPLCRPRLLICPSRLPCPRPPASLLGWESGHLAGPVPLRTAGFLCGATPTGHWLPLRALPASCPTAGEQGARPLLPHLQHGSPKFPYSACPVSRVWPGRTLAPWTAPGPGRACLPRGLCCLEPMGRGAQRLGSRGQRPF